MAVRRISYEMLTERPFREKLSLDGKPCQIFIRKFERVETVLPHYHPEFEIIIPRGIRGETVVPGGKYSLAGGRVHCIPGNAVHAFKLVPDRESEVWVLQLDAERLGLARNEAWLSRFSMLSKSHSDRVSGLASELLGLGRDDGSRLPDPADAYGALSSLYGIIAAIAQENPLPPIRKRSEARVRRVLDVLEALAHRSVTLDEIARKCAISKFHLCRFFKAQTGVTLTHYLNRLRVYRAMHLMGELGKNATEASFECGFENPSYFIQVFAKIAGETPKQWALKRSGG